MVTPKGCWRCDETPPRLVPLFIKDDKGRYNMGVFCPGCAMLELGIVDKPSEGEGGDSEDK